MKATRKQIIETARQYVGTPFQHMGRTARGLDCVGLIVRVAQDLGLSDYDLRAYHAQPKANVFSKAWRDCPDIRRVANLKDAQPGDILTMALPSYPCHVVLLAEQGRIIHALAQRGQVCEHRLNQTWWKRCRECYAFLEVDEWLN